MSYVQPANPLTESILDFGFLNHQLTLNIEGPVSFYWTDFKEACELYREKSIHDPQVKAAFEKKMADLERMKQMPVWIRTDSSITHTNLYDLYQSHILHKSQNPQNVLTSGPTDISFISPSGPFKKLAVTDCFNLENYQDFVLVLLLQRKLKEREFRIRLQSRLLIEYGEQSSQASLVDLEQITSSGLLFKCTANVFFQEIRPNGHVRVLMKNSMFDSINHAQNWEETREVLTHWPARPLYTQNKQESFRLNCEDFQITSRFDFGSTQEVYFFVSFDVTRKSNEIATMKIEKFVQKARTHILEIVKNNAA
jgi:hypothetical protein